MPDAISHPNCSLFHEVTSDVILSVEQFLLLIVLQWHHGLVDLCYAGYSKCHLKMLRAFLSLVSKT